MPEPLPLTHARFAGFGRDDFMVAPCNAVALAMLDGWRDWPRGKLLLTGPAGAGKTHLAHIWADETGARIIAAQGLAAADLPTLGSGPLVVEDLHRITQRADEEALFHLHNLLLAGGQSLLMTGEGAVSGWGLTLPDLQSRIQQAQSATVQPPDDALLQMLLVKLFSERQLNVPPPVIDYLTRRMDRSFDGARRIVAALDAASLAEKRAITTRLAARVLDTMDSAGS